MEIDHSARRVTVTALASGIGLATAQRSAALVEESAAGMGLRDQAARLKKAVGQFRLKPA